VIDKRIPAEARPDFGLNDAVCLLSGQSGVLTGALGRILGKFPHPGGGPTYAVVFVDKKVIALALRPDEIVFAIDYEADAEPQPGPRVLRVPPDIRDRSGRPITEELVAALVCLECGTHSDEAAQGWRAFLMDDRVAVYCGECAEAEFDDDGTAG
jgi:hypothetical protein